MLSKLIHRPVAVLLSFFAVVVLGVLATSQLPVGLLPEVGIPRLSVQITYPNAAARTLENAVVAPLRQQLLQVAGLSDIQSRTYDERAVIYLDFPFGTNPDLAFIEVNELIDRAMSGLPRELDRPRVLATDISDLPVVDLAITLGSQADSPTVQAGENDQLLELSDLARRLFRRRLEQLPEIAFADLSGQLERRVVVIPQPAVLSSLAIEENELATLLTTANLETSNLLLADGHYVYNVRLSNQLRSVEDLKRLALNHRGRVLRLDELAQIKEVAEPARGYFFQNGRSGVVFSLRKQSAARLFDLRRNLDELLTDLRANYPDYRFELTNDQTAVLTASIDNLRTGLLYGAGFAILILFAFFREWRRPLLVGLAVPVALLIALLGFYLAGLSVNVISLAGLILGLGLMIDNSIIVLDNIRQLRLQGLSATLAAQRGADEVIRPLITSALTTMAVFLPLVLLSGVAGALFRDQAIAVSLSLFASLLVAYFLLPLLSRGKAGAQTDEEVTAVVDQETTTTARPHRFVPLQLLGWLLLLFGVGWWLLGQLPVAGFPTLSRTDYRLSVDWNAPISLAENRERSLEIAEEWRRRYGGRSATEVGEHRYLLEEENRAVNASELRFFLEQPRRSTEYARDFLRDLAEEYPTAVFAFSALPNLFDRVFAADQEAPLLIKSRSTRNRLTPDWLEVAPLVDELRQNGWEVVAPARSGVVTVALKYEQLRINRVTPERLRSRLLTLFSENEITRLREGDQNLAVVLTLPASASGELSLSQLRSATVRNQDDQLIPLGSLIEISEQSDYKTLTADRAGEYAGLVVPGADESTDLTQFEDLAAAAEGLIVQLDGGLFRDRERVAELFWVLLVALLLLYLILAAQFESLVQPLVVLLVVPASLVGAATGLWLLGESLNLVSLIGMVVTGGIVVNDAIIKLEMIQRGRQRLGMNRTAAIRYAHRRRIQAILMTSITTILALAPVLFTAGLGAELQRPLAIAVIGGLLAGTLASLYFLPLVYLVLVRE